MDYPSTVINGAAIYMGLNPDTEPQQDIVWTTYRGVNISVNGGFSGSDQLPEMLLESLWGLFNKMLENGINMSQCELHMEFKPKAK